MAGIEEYLLDEAEYEWEDSRRPERVGKGFLIRVFGDAPGRPSYTLSTQPEGFVNPAHFHNKPQFQVIWDGSVEFPTHALAPIAVHYTDASFPYGPFNVGPDLLLGVYRPRPANQIYMSDRERRKERNPYGREFLGTGNERELYGQSDTAAWKQADDVERCILIDPAAGGPGAELSRYRPGTAIERPAAPYGEFVIVADGSAVVDGRTVGKYSARWSRGDEPSSAMVAGAAGVTLLVLTYDDAAAPFYDQAA
jgi:hypothetical protein